MAESILVLLDHVNGKIFTPSLETLALGQQLAEARGCALSAVILSAREDGLVEQVADKAVDSVKLLLDEKLESYDPDSYCEALKQLVSKDPPFLLLMGHIYQNIDMAPKLAAAINRGIVTDCIGYRQDGSDLVFIRQMFRNKLNSEVRVRSDHPWIVTLQAGSCSVDDLKEGSASVERVEVDLSSLEVRRKALEAFEAIKGKVDLTRAEAIVAVGRGIKKAENMQIIEELAEALDAELAASRPVVDNEWLSRDRQIGSSGQTVAPRIYVACGISGAIQHIVGMKNSDCIIAINTDANAPIFNIATYGIVGDLFQIVPLLTKKLKALKG